ncbi:MAG TPA: ferrous iron transporter B [Sphingorhabdus lacus]|uniref:Ferrous iron transport protein B n=1 Tax=Sphingorhabdus lacus TaxID=392610 RepID=A0A6I6L5Y6_9SPHN|nr:ferrous iron transporter B [Sphingorhabdus lacus]QGY81405.1 ferrous iron transporter B [Sphingorhabdus lacus]HNW18775.1 ferrous iron transporter B [Sphingorhabdus lacus]HPV67798.1 ferrous iron transporter B [Sphingorhabdus lacus]
MSGTVPLVALVGNPNSGKSSLFNALTGARQKIANYPGVTVERKSGRTALPDGRPVELLDLPGAYSLQPDSLDEAVTRDVVLGKFAGQRRPDALVIVVDAGNLDNHLRFAIELIGQGLPVVIALNMVDLAERDGLEIDPTVLADELGVPVVSTVAVRKRGLERLLSMLSEVLSQSRPDEVDAPENRKQITDRAHRIAKRAIISETQGRQWTKRLDAILLHPVGGVAILLALLFVMFQAVYGWSEAPIGWIESGFSALTETINAQMPNGILRSFLTDGVIAGVGSVVVFLPQILILFLFILLLEATGYMTRAAFVMDRMMAAVGLSGHSFIPLLSSFACAIPGIMATRSIMDQKERLATILIAPLMTCSARLPVYTLIIGAFIPAQNIGPGIGMQGLVLFALYLFGIVGAMLAAAVIQRFVTQSRSSSFLIEMPRYQLPRPSDIALGLWQRAWVFLRRAGTIIFVATVILWALLSFPKVPVNSTQSQVEYSIAGRIADGIEPIIRPIGFNHDIALALIPAMAAREVAVSALGTAYAIDAEDEEQAAMSLGPQLAAKWSLATALAFLAWFIFAPQCISTIAVTRRETNGWKWPIFMVVYLFALAYAAAGITYWTAVSFGL